MSCQLSPGPPPHNRSNLESWIFWENWNVKWGTTWNRLYLVHRLMSEWFVKHLVKFVFRRTWKNHKITHLICYDTWKNLDKVTQFLLCEINVLLTNYYLCTYFEGKKWKIFYIKIVFNKARKSAPSPPW